MQQKQCIIGTKQVLRAAETGRLAAAVLADDIALPLRQKLERALSDAGVPFERGACMRELGRQHGIEVGAAVVGCLRADMPAE